MCNPVSGITKSDGTVFLPSAWNHSHSELANANGIPGGVFGDKYARWELTPENGDFQSDPDTWKFKLDESRAPSWWSDDAAALEDKARREVKRYVERGNTEGWMPWCQKSATGESGSASATGDSGSASATGDSGSASATGYRGSASATGKENAAVGTNRNCRVKCGENGVLVCAERDADWNLIGWVFGVAGKDGIKAHTWYRAEGGKLVETDDDITRDADARIAEMTPKV